MRSHLQKHTAIGARRFAFGWGWLNGVVGGVAGSMLLLFPSVGGPVYSVKISAPGRYLVDQNNAPFLIVGASPQAMAVNVSLADAASYLADRATNGFNTVLMEVLCNTYTGGRANGSMLDGTLPFTNTIPSTTSYDLTAPNETYFARIDQIVRMAATNGIQVMLDPIETGGWLTTMLDNGTANCRAYGQYLGNRYKDFPNVIWFSGNDFQNWQNANDDAVVTAVALGIKDEDTNHLQTIELNYFSSSSLDDPNWAPIVGLNGAYTYYPTYDEVLHAYRQSTNTPTFLEEANYEFESLISGEPLTTAPILRKQEYWTILSGGLAGQLYGNHYTWAFLSGWQTNLETLGTLEMKYVTALFAPRAWYNLIPDTNHVVVTAGYGTYSSSGYVANNNYLTAARTPDGTLVIAYTPVIQQFTVDMSKLNGPVVARWYEPTTGAYIPIAGSPLPNTGTRNFTPPGNNTDGDGGWALVLETVPPALPVQPALVQQNYATPQTSQTSVSVTYSNAQFQGDINILAIGWFDTNASIGTVSDSAGNAYQTALSTFRSNNMSQAIYYSTNIASGANTVTVTFNQAAKNIDLRATEYSGPATIFEAGNSAGGDGSFANSGSVATTSTNELIFGAGVSPSGFATVGTGFADGIITVPGANIVEDRVAVASGTYNATANVGSSNAWLMQVAAFKDPLPDNGVPSLRIFRAATNTVVVAWPGYILQQNPNLTTTSWVDSINAITVVSNRYQVIISPLAGQEFFRLESTTATPSLNFFLMAVNTGVVTWPGFILQQNSDLTATNWVYATNPIRVVSNEYQIIVSPLAGQEFYRLKYP